MDGIIIVIIAILIVIAVSVFKIDKFAQTVEYSAADEAIKVSKVTGIYRGQEGTKNPNIAAPEKYKCPDGTIETNGHCAYTNKKPTPPVCPPGNDAKGLECWKSPPVNNSWTTTDGILYGKTCEPGVNDSGSSCWYNRGPGVPPTCGSELVQKGVECYKKPEIGWDWTTKDGLLVGKKCPDTTQVPGGWDDGTSCKYDRGVGTIPICQPGADQIGLDCYNPPPPDREWTDTLKIVAKHGKICPPDTRNNVGNTECLYSRGEGEALKCDPLSDQLGFKCWEKPAAGREWVDRIFPAHGDLCQPGTSGTLDGENCSYDRTNTTAGLICPPNKEQRGLLCYDKPGPGRDWTTPGGLIHGVVCPPGTNDSGTTCWYKRDDKPLQQKPCAPGERDDGVSCWKDTYGRGAGRGRDQSCPAGWRNDGVTCWEPLAGGACRTVDNGHWTTSWGSVGCTGGRPWIPQGYNDCYNIWAPKIETTCDAITGGRTQATTYSCNANEDMWGLSCYPKCASGYHVVGCCLCEANGGPITATNDARVYCPDGQEPNATKTFCLDIPKKILDIPANCNKGAICDIPKDLKGATLTGGINSCPPGKELANNNTICYDVPKAGFECKGGSICIKSRNKSPGVLFSKSDANKAGWIDYCSPGKHKEGELCYSDTRTVTDPTTGIVTWQSTCIAGSCGFNKDVKFTPSDNSNPNLPGSRRSEGITYCTGFVGALKETVTKNRVDITTTRDHGLTTNDTVIISNSMNGADISGRHMIRVMNSKTFRIKFAGGTYKGTCDVQTKVNEDGLCYSIPRIGERILEGEDTLGAVVTQKLVTQSDIDNKLVNRNVPVGSARVEYNYDCTATSCGFDKNIKWGDRSGLVDKCADNAKLIGGLCITNPKEDYKGSSYGCFLGICGYDKHVTAGTRSDGVEIKDKDGNTVTEKDKDGNVVPVKSNLTYYCPEGNSLINGLCYLNPKSGFTCKDGYKCEQKIPSKYINLFTEPVTEEYKKAFAIPGAPLIL